MKNLLFATFVVVAAVTISGCMNIIPSVAPKVGFEEGISDEFNFEPHYVDVLGSKMHFVDEGQVGDDGKTILLVHGNPTSSYLWRNIIPGLSVNNRVIALDLIGMGKSDKPLLDYTLQDHVQYFNQFIENLNLQDITLVLHDWGGAIGLNYHANYSDNVEGLVIMEAVVKPGYWKDANMVERYIFKNLRDEKKGTKLIVDQNYFLEKLLPMMSGRKLTESEMDYYNSPYQTFASRKVVKMWPQEIPLDEVPMRNHVLVGENYEFLRTAGTPVTFLYGEPGMIFNEKLRADLAIDFPDSNIISIGEGMHYLQETQPTNITNEVLSFIDKTKN